MGGISSQLTLIFLQLVKITVGWIYRYAYWVYALNLVLEIPVIGILKMMIGSYMIKLILMMLLCSNAFAITQDELYSAISCNSEVNSVYYEKEFRQKYGNPIKSEGGALWFKA